MQTGVTSKSTRQRTVQGVVMDAQNVPLIDAMIRLWADAERTALVLESKTDESGKFRLTSVKRGTYFVEFLVPGFHPYLTEIRVSNVSSATGFVFSPLMASAAQTGNMR